MTRMATLMAHGTQPPLPSPRASRHPGPRPPPSRRRSGWPASGTPAAARSGSSRSTVRAGRASPRWRRDVRGASTPPVVHMDDIYPGWDGLADAGALTTRSWSRSPPAGPPHTGGGTGSGPLRAARRCPPTPLLVLEGAARACCPAFDYAAVAVWVEADRGSGSREASTATARPTGRTGSAGPAEEALFAADRTRDRADVVLDTTARAGPDGDVRAWPRPRPCRHGQNDAHGSGNGRPGPSRETADRDASRATGAPQRRARPARPAAPAGSARERVDRLRSAASSSCSAASAARRLVGGRDLLGHPRRSSRR